MMPYAKDYALTDSVLQEAQDNAKLELFGSAEDNICYARGVANQLRRLDHEVELIFGNQRETLKKATATVLSEEAERRKKAKEIMDKAERLKFIKKWKTDNDVYLKNVFGMEDGPQFLFLTCILFATSSSKHLVPLLQDEIQADGAHASYGKYIVFLAYGTTANGNMSPLAFGLLFRNKNTKNWSKFWMFVKKFHPSIDGPTKTMLTDQDKGSIAAIEEKLPQAAQFYCLFHHRQNIIKKCGGGIGCTPLMALWMYILLSSCNSVKQLENNKAKYYDKMHPTDRHYLTKLPDRSQYHAARCAMGDNICMYSKLALSGVESMNKANQLAQQRTAVDILNSVILLIELEAERFNWYKQKAWERDNQLLTEGGLELMEEAFVDVDIRELWINVTKEETLYKCTVIRMKSTSEFTVTIPMKDTMRSRFGSCTCRKPTKDGVPCKHMVAIVKASKIEGLS